MKRVSSHGYEVAETIEAREEFKTGGALSAEWAKSYFSAGRGQLHCRYAELLGQDLYESGPAYIVYSYQTPIAWWTEKYGWRVPDVRYSLTTSKHQGRLYKVRPGHYDAERKLWVDSTKVAA